MKDKLVEEFLGYLEVERNASPRTLGSIATHCAIFVRRRKRPRWRQCGADDFRDYLFDLMKRRQARSYIRLQFSALRTFYRFLVARNRLTERSGTRDSIPESREKTAAGFDAAADRRTARRPACR